MEMHLIPITGTIDVGPCGDLPAEARARDIVLLEDDTGGVIGHGNHAGDQAASGLACPFEQPSFGMPSADIAPAYTRGSACLSQDGNFKLGVERFALLPSMRQDGYEERAMQPSRLGPRSTPSTLSSSQMPAISADAKWRCGSSRCGLYSASC